jgi:amidohydrolase
VTVGTIQGGHRYNILAGRVVMTGTVRTLSEASRRRTRAFLSEAVAGAAKASGARVRMDYEVLGPPLINDAAMADFARRTAEALVGPRRTIRLEAPSMGAEDFAEYLGRAPGCYVYLGTGADAKTRRPWHHPSFFLHEEAMATGVDYLCALAREGLKSLASVRAG